VCPNQWHSLKKYIHSLKEFSKAIICNFYLTGYGHSMI
jgi:hypothetical protein